MLKKKLLFVEKKSYEVNLNQFYFSSIYIQFVGISNKYRIWISYYEIMETWSVVLFVNLTNLVRCMMVSDNYGLLLL